MKSFKLLLPSAKKRSGARISFIALHQRVHLFLRMHQLLKDIRRSPFDGIGKPEPLRYCEGYWSRRIDEKNRLVYAVSGEGDIIVLSCRGHYEK